LLAQLKAVDILPALGVEHLHPEVKLAQRYQNRIELLQGTLDLLILQTLRWGPQHGYGISQAIRTNSGDILQVDTGSLYPALHRLERQKWVAAEWKVSENKQRVRVYRLTPKGKKQLESERSRWAQVSDAIAGVLNPAKRESEA
jgi:PadR family transcriptional regulator, regulatory protein PadR